MRPAARAIVRLATSALYRATRGRLRVYDSRQLQLAPIGSLTVSPEQSIHDPAVFGTYDLATQRIVTIADPTEGAFSLDQIKGDAQRQRAAGTALSNDRYALALSMLEQGRGICLNACTSAPRDDVRGTVKAKGYAYRPIDLNATGDSGVGREDLTRLSFADGSIARIISCDTIEHIPDYPAATITALTLVDPRLGIPVARDKSCARKRIFERSSSAGAGLGFRRRRRGQEPSQHRGAPVGLGHAGERFLWTALPLRCAPLRRHRPVRRRARVRGDPRSSSVSFRTWTSDISTAPSSSTSAAWSSLTTSTPSATIRYWNTWSLSKRWPSKAAKSNRRTQ